MTMSSKTSGVHRVRHRLLATAAVLAGVLVAASLSTGTASADTPKGANSGYVSKTPSGLNDLLRKANQAMAQGHANVAVLYLKNATALAPRNAAVHTQLGLAELQSGDPGSAEREFRTALANGAPQAQVNPYLYDAMLLKGEAQLLLLQFPAPPDSDHSPLASATLRARAVAFAQTNDKGQAANAMDKALTIDRSPINLVTRARLYNDAGDRASASKLIDEALAKTPTDPTTLQLKITILQLEDKANEALNYANTLVKAHGNYALGYVARAGVYMQLNQDAKALTDANTALSITANLPQAVYFKAMIRARAKDPKGAWAIAQVLPPEFLRMRPDIGIIVSQMAIDAGHPELGTSILSALVARYPDNADARVKLGGQYLRLHDSQRALETLLPLKDGGDPRVMILLGESYEMQKQYGASTEYFEKAISNGYGGDLLKQEVANSNLRYGNLDNAIQEYKDLFAKNPGDPQIAGPLIAALLQKHDVQGASAVANKLAEASPNSPYGTLFQGQLAMNRGDVDSAITFLSRSIASDKNFIPAIYDRAVCYIAKADYKSANADLNAIVASDPRNVMALIRGAQIALNMGQLDKVPELLKRAIAVDPKNTMSNMALATFYFTHNRVKDAAATVASFLQRVPTDPTALAFEGQIQIATGHADKAVDTFRMLAKTHPDVAQLQVLLGNALAAKKDTLGAMAAYQRAVQLAPKLKSARTSLIRFALANHNQEVAIATAQDGVQRDPGPDSDLTLAATQATIGRLDAAEATLKRSLSEHPSEAAAVALSEIERRAGHGKDADAVLTSWMAGHPDSINARLIYAQNMMTANPVVAEQQFHTVLKAQPYNTVALNNLSWMLQNKDPHQALAYAEQAAKQAPTSPPVLDTLGWVKWQNKDGAGALPLLQKAHAADAGNGEITYHLAVVLAGTGHRDEAKKTLAALLATNAPFEDRQKAVALTASWR
ncbi:MAG: PEP-CTERM system TPR-repeat protein PrsT [Alphaproteobacteria bacterium]|nr:PEP-CTERM system TPR-repeat protein PrsT [Alphaproteobacteria bacterium]